MRQRLAVFSTITLIVGTTLETPTWFIGYSGVIWLAVGCSLATLGVLAAMRADPRRSLGWWLGLGAAMGASVFHGAWTLVAALLAGGAAASLASRAVAPYELEWGVAPSPGLFVCRGRRCRREGAGLVHASLTRMARGSAMRIYWARCLGVCEVSPAIVREPGSTVCRLASLQDIERFGAQIGGFHAHRRDSPSGD